MVTTIQDKGTYKEMNWDLIEDTKELDAKTKKELEDARAEIKAGKVHTLAQIKKDMM